jgi:hypothetical protein
LVALMDTYHAHVERGDRYWLVRVREVDRWTQARRLREVEEMARDLVAVMLDVDADSFQLDVTYDLPDSVRRRLAEADRLRQESDAAKSAAAAESRAAARELVESGLSLRDTAQLLGLSYQRVHQLVYEDRPRKAG